MRKNSIKITVLALVLLFSMALGTSCTVVSPTTSDNVCLHKSVKAGDCQTRATCTVCGEQVGDFGSHSYTLNVVDADCVNGGYTEHKCKVCGDTYRDNSTVTTDHTYGEWVFSKQPTDTEDGEMYRECSVCGTRETETVAAHVHDLAYADAKAVTCSSDGWAAYEYCTLCEYTTKQVIKSTGHSWGAYTSNGDSTHTRVCANDPTHVLTENCSGGTVTGSGLPICSFCNTEYDFAARAGNSTYGYHALGTYATYGEGMQKLYKDMVTVCEEFYTDNDDVVLDDSYYILAEFDTNDYSIDINAACAVWKVLYVSNPLYYWLDARIVTSGDTFILTIADDYAKAADRRVADIAIQNMTDECNALIEDGMTDLEKAVTIVEYITKNMEYAYESDGTTPEDDMWAHCMAGFAMHSFGVCEAYAKTFMYLCLLNGVECVMGSGYAGEPHAWNYVKLGGEWYGADITWTDNSGDDPRFDYFGMSAASIFADHTPHSSTELDDDYIYEAPELSDKDIILVEVHKDGSYLGLYKSIEDAFAAMTDENGEYTVNIDFYSFYVGAPTHVIGTVTTPNVKKLTIVGRNEVVGSGYLDNNSLLYVSGTLTFGSDVELVNLHVIPSDSEPLSSIHLAGHTLTLSGKSMYFDLKIFGTEDESTVVAETTDVVYFNRGVDIYRLVLNNAGAAFGANSKIEYGPTHGLYVMDGSIEIDIKHYT